ncbi:MAG: LacI family DNA-binding transcriptional regulator [Armatimonadota bacterium]
MPPTIKTVAEMAGVSITTVSFVLNNKRPQVDGLSKETRERVLACAAALGYRRNPTAVSLRSGKSLWIGVVIQPVRDEADAQVWAPYELALISGVENALLNLGYFPVLGSKSTTGDTQALDTLAYSGVAGLIYRRPLREEVARLEELRADGVACIAVFPARAGDLYPYQVDLDNVKAGDLGADLIYRAGRTRPGIIVSGLFGHIEEDRTKGFCEGVERRLGRPALICDASGSMEERVRMGTIVDFLGREKPDAVLATESWGASLVSYAAEEVGLRVPEDLIIIGFDCASFRSARDQVVSAITTSWWHAGRVAAQSVVDIVQNGTQWDKPKKLDPRFIPGDTTPPELSAEGERPWLL